jgi:hypothetical protein
MFAPHLPFVSAVAFEPDMSDASFFQFFMKVGATDPAFVQAPSEPEQAPGSIYFRSIGKRSR